MKRFLALIFLSSPCFALDPCDPSHVISSLVPGQSFSISNQDPTTFQFVGPSTYTTPSLNDINKAISICRSSSTLRSAQKLSALADLKVAPNAVNAAQQIQSLKILLDLDQ